MVTRKFTLSNMIFFLITLISFGAITDSANILYVPFASKSQNILLRPIRHELARRGHNLTVITAFEDFNIPENYNQVLTDNTSIWEAQNVIGNEHSVNKRPNIFTPVDMSDEEFHNIIFWKGGLAATEIALKSPNFQTFLKKSNKFDLVISEIFYLEAVYALAHKYNAPLVLATGYGNCMRHNIITGNPLQQATVIPENAFIHEPKSFAGRLRTFYLVAYEYFWWRFWYLDQQAQLAKKYIPNLPQPMPSLLELQRNVSLVLVNSHFSFDVPMALLPNVVEIGGIHLCEEHLKLPDDIQNIMDKSHHGVIYMSFGSNLKSSELSKEKRDAFLNVFKKLKQTVLWKYEDDIENKPDNVITRNWMPQRSILAHPNVIVFVAHGGLIGMQEAIYHGVPVIGVPIYADQYNNLLQAQQIGFARILKYHDINEENLESALNSVMRDSSYKAKAKYVSRRFKDRPMSALDTAMFWIEYVIRHKGADFMKNPATRLSWIEYNMLDVYAFVLAVMFTSVLVIVKVLIILKNEFVSKPKRVLSKKNL